MANKPVKMRANPMVGKKQPSFAAKLQNQSKAGFVPTVSTSASLSKSAIQALIPHLLPAVHEMVNKKIPETYRIISETVRNNPEFIQNAKGAITGVFKGNSSKASGQEGGNTSYGLSKAPNPRKVKLNSGILPNTYTQDYMFPVVLACDPMHISSALLQIPTSTTNPLNTYFIQTIAFDIQTRAQTNVGFDIGVGTNFTATQILTGFNAAISALQHYYWFSSILSYESDPANKNAGMIALRQSITAQQLSLLAQLGRRLEDTPIPPRIVEWVKFMMANYYSGDNQGAAIIKICPNTTLLTGSDATAVSVLTAQLNALSTNANNTVYALMRRAIPQWRIAKLYDVTPIPNHDMNFTTIFSNMPFCVWDGTAAVVGPSVTGPNSSISYNTFTNKLDGVAFACTGMRDTVNNDLIPGMVFVNAVSQGINISNTSTRLSYALQGGISAFYATDGSTFNTASRQDSYQIPVATTSIITPHLYGADKCQNVNSNSTLQSAYNTLDFLVNVSSIPNKGQLNSFNRRANGMV